MRKEIILKRDNGNKVKIIASLYLDSVDGAVYNIDVEYCEKGKRTWHMAWSSDDFYYRREDAGGRRKFILDSCLKYVTAEEIQQAKESLWQELKP